MTPKEKAQELIDKYDSILTYKAKQCALIVVDEIIEGVERAFDEYEKANDIYVKNRIFYWDFYSDVKSEIYKL
jgi:hypothetical protein